MTVLSPQLVAMAIDAIVSLRAPAHRWQGTQSCR